MSFTWTPIERVALELGELRVLMGTDVPFGVNFVLDFPIEEKMALCLDAGVRVVSTFWGDPAPWAARIHAAGAVHLHTVASAAEAVRAVDAGVDAVVCQGWEAGGHVWGGAASLPLIPAVVDAVSPVPVIAAGGIADGRGLAAVLALGAQAAWVGTRFLASEEARTHEVYRAQVVAAAETDAVHTLAFDGGWPGAAHRALRNSTIDRWEAAGRPAAPGRPGERDVVASGPWGDQLRYGDMMPLPGMRGDLEAMALYAGQSAGLVREVLPAARIVDEFHRDARSVLSGLAGS
jgi:NAD(P)H-dependent flavin oxidoreductase YrpB (nitropropane dioxygenase family)